MLPPSNEEEYMEPEPKEAIIVLNEHVRIAKVLNERVSEQMCTWRWLVGPVVQKGKLFSMGGGAGWGTVVHSNLS